LIVVISGVAIAKVLDYEKISPQEREKRDELAEQERVKRAKLTEQEREELVQERAKLAEQEIIDRLGTVNSAMICPHCQTKGQVRTISITQKKGVSGGKATAALMTCGVSMLAVGLSRKEEATQAHCDACNNTWVF
jgi:hypothetical protein